MDRPNSLNKGSVSTSSYVVRTQFRDVCNAHLDSFAGDAGIEYQGYLLLIAKLLFSRL